MPAVTALNAIDYRLVSGTTADQTSNLQAAINAAQTQQLPLFVPSGTYHIQTVTITEPIVIYSSGNRPLFIGFNGVSPSISIHPTVAGNRFGPVEIRNLELNGENNPFETGSSHGALISVSEVNSLVLENCSLSLTSNYGISLVAVSGVIECNSITGSVAFGIFSTDAYDGVIIRNNSIRYSGNNGIFITRSASGSDFTTIENNLIGQSAADGGGTGANGNGIVVWRANYVKVMNNKILTSAFSGVRLNTASSCSVYGNYIWNSGETAIYLESPTGLGGEYYTGGEILNNIIEVCGSGISVTNSNIGSRRVIVSGNQIVTCTNNTIYYDGGTYQTWGAGIFAEGDVLVGSNQIESADSFGIILYTTNGNVPIIGANKVLSQCENNMINRCAGGVGVYKDDTSYGRLLIGGNMISQYTDTTRFAAVVPVSYNGTTGEVSRLPGSVDVANSTSSGFSNVQLLMNFAFL